MGYTIPIEFDNNNQWTILNTAVEIGKKLEKNGLSRELEFCFKSSLVFNYKHAVYL